MPYHVEIRRSFRRAWAFNLSPERLHREVTDPWLAGRQIELGDRRWKPSESELRIIEGPELSPSDLAFGQGWNSAERSGHGVTREILAAATTPPATKVAVIAEAPVRGRVLEALAAVGADGCDFAAARERLLREGEAPANTIAAAVIVVSAPEPSPDWLFDAGLAIGALGHRARVVLLGAAAPPALRGVEALRLDPGDPETLRALAEHLARAAATPDKGRR